MFISRHFNRRVASYLRSGRFLILGLYACGLAFALQTVSTAADAQAPSKAPTYPRVYSSSNPSVLGDPVTFTAWVRFRNAGVPTGTVAFKDGAATLGSAPVRASGLGGILATGGGHTCALRRNEQADCWGSNVSGQLGNGTTTDSKIPVPVIYPLGEVFAMTAGTEHTCAIDANLGVSCWGANVDGQLGDGTRIQRLNPVQVKNLASLDIIGIAGGDGHTCALTGAGMVQCWGANGAGQLGNGTNTDSLTPVAVSGLASGAVAIVAGATHSCAITAAGGVKCWGDNASGQLGNGTTTGSNVPVDVTGLTAGMASLAANNDHTCAVGTDGGMKCWGANNSGQLGNNSYTSSPTPVQVTGLTSGVAAATAGGFHTCALMTDGTARCWGYNSDGELGNGTTTDSPTPVIVTGLAGGADISSGNTHTCVARSDGSAVCWGANDMGQLGNGTMAASSTPVAVTGYGPGTALIYGIATFTAKTLAIGKHSITADYSGDATHAPGVSPAFAQVVDAYPTATSLASSLNPSAFSDKITFTATVTSSHGTPTGTVTFKNGATTLGTGALSKGKAVLSTSKLNAGQYTITADYGGAATFAPSTSVPLKQIVGDAKTTTTVTSSLNPSKLGDKVTFTATITTAKAGSPSIGTVIFRNGIVEMGQVNVTKGGKATLSTSKLPVGVSKINALFNGAPNYLNSASPDLKQTVNKATVSIALKASATQSRFGETVRLTAKVSPLAKGSPEPAGTVNFKRGGKTLQSVPLAGGVAKAVITGLPVGAHGFSAVHAGDTNYRKATTLVLDHTVIRGKTTVSVNSSAADEGGANGSAISPGEPVTFAVRVRPVSPASGIPDGPVALYVNGKTVQSLALLNGRATFAQTFQTGDHAVRVDFGGSGSWKSSKSATQTLSIDPRGEEFQVNTTVKQAQEDAALAALDDGTFVAVWSSNGQDGSGRSVHTQRFKVTKTGQVKKQGGESQVNTYAAADQSNGVLTGVKKASWLYAWESEDQDAALLGEDQSTGIYMQRYAADGEPDGGEMRVNDETRRDQTDPALTNVRGRTVVAAWVSGDQDGDGTGIFARLFKANGTPKSGDIQVNDEAAGDQSDPAIAGLAGGGFVIAFVTPDGNGTGVHQRRFDRAGRPKRKARRVNTETAGDQSEPALAALADGGYVVSWTSDRQDGSKTGIFAQRFDAKGMAKGAEIAVNSTTKKAQAQSHITALADGGFLISWHSQGQDGSGFGVYAQRFTAKGKAKGVEFRVNQTVKHDQAEPALTTLPDGSVIAAWTSDKQDGAKHGIFGIKLDFADAVGDRAR